MNEIERQMKLAEPVFMSRYVAKDFQAISTATNLCRPFLAT